MRVRRRHRSVRRSLPVRLFRGPSPACSLYRRVSCVAIATLIGEIIIGYFDIATLTLLYLLPRPCQRPALGTGPSLFASFLGVLALDFFFVPPLLQLRGKPITKDLAALAIFLLVG